MSGEMYTSEDLRKARETGMYIGAAITAGATAVMLSIVSVVL